LSSFPPGSRQREFLSGLRDESPILLGVAPFGMIYGILALKVGIPSGVAQAMSAIVFAGSAQLVLAQLIGSGTPALIMIVTVFVVNLRHALYSASIAPHMQKLSPLWKTILSYLLTDEAYAVSIIHYGKPGEAEHRHWYFLGAGLALWTAWQISCAVGIFLGARLPSDWGLDFTLALTFIALVIPAIKDKPGIMAAVTAGITVVLAAGLPYKLGLLVATLAGILAGLWSETRWLPGSR
jgi:4-azaleucine resistance transporter AzlC